MTENILNISFLEGKNFSGRTNFLKQSCSLSSESNNTGIYVGEIPYNYLSGVSPTVIEELQLFSQNSKKEILEAINKLLKHFGFEKLYNNNPFTLSGGEQVVLSIMIGLLLEPSLLAIDTATEQLNKEWSEPIFNLMQDNFASTCFLIADNRIDEYTIKYRTLTPSNNRKNFKYTFLKPGIKYTEPESSPKEVALKNIVFGYVSKIHILQNITVNLEPGNIYFLKGANGAGKTTLAKVLSGILKPQGGKIIINNEEINLYKYPGKIFGYSFQNPDEQLFSRSIEEEVLRFNKKESKNISNRRELYLEMFGLNEIHHFHPAEMPYVMRKRIALAATLATDRPWYILDEPTIGQDSDFLDFLTFLFKQLVEQGKGLIIISHSQTFIDKFTPKILYLDKGRITSY
jgi:energy-coupling factor transport system ATP-binding protein